MLFYLYSELPPCSSVVCPSCSIAVLALIFLLAFTTPNAFYRYKAVYTSTSLR